MKKKKKRSESCNIGLKPVPHEYLPQEYPRARKASGREVKSIQQLLSAQVPVGYAEASERYPYL